MLQLLQQPVTTLAAETEITTQTRLSKKTEQKRVHQKDSRILNDLCISRMYVTEFFDLHIEVTYISVRSTELQFLPFTVVSLVLIPESTKQVVSQKICHRIIPTERILEGIQYLK